MNNSVFSIISFHNSWKLMCKSHCEHSLTRSHFLDVTQCSPNALPWHPKNGCEGDYCEQRWQENVICNLRVNFGDIKWDNFLTFESKDDKVAFQGTSSFTNKKGIWNSTKDKLIINKIIIIIKIINNNFNKTVPVTGCLSWCTIRCFVCLQSTIKVK